MEPFRIVVDEFVYKNLENEFTPEYKIQLVDLLNKKVEFCGKEYYLTNVIQLYLKKTFDTIEKMSIDALALYEFK